MGVPWSLGRILGGCPMEPHGALLEPYVGLRSDLYDHYGNEIKRMLASRVELLDGVWMARSVTMMNLVTNRLSNMAFLEIYTGIDVEDEVLTQRTLTDAAFRETQLQSIREQVE